jgi:GT2 family glycosyltransferase
MMMDIAAADLPSPSGVLVSPSPSLGIQTVLFHNEPEAIFRSLLSIGRATELAIAEGAISSAEVAYGDSTPHPVFRPGELDDYVATHAPHLRVAYVHFGENLGSAGGNNRLLPLSSTELTMVCNPDVVPAPDTYIELVRPFAKPGIGIVEARQLPVEHPKDYDAVTGETGWASGACMMIPRRLMRALGGFDSESFFLYCDDVDLSWRVRLAGFRILFQPSAVVFHDKSLSVTGRWQPTEAERYYSAEAALLMAHKWSQPRRVELLLKQFSASADENLKKAATEFQRRARHGLLREPVDPAHKVGYFAPDGNYTQHRYAL